MPQLVVNFQARLWAQSVDTATRPVGEDPILRAHFLCLQCPTLESPLIFSIHSFSSLLLPISLSLLLPEKTEGFSLEPCFKQSLRRRLGCNGLALN